MQENIWVDLLRNILQSFQEKAEEDNKIIKIELHDDNKVLYLHGVERDARHCLEEVRLANLMTCRKVFGLLAVLLWAGHLWISWI